MSTKSAAKVAPKPVSVSKSNQVSISDDLPEIYMVKVYQSVLFEGGQQTYFTCLNVIQHKEVKAEIYKDLGMVRITSDRDDIMVPFANIAAIYFKSKIRQEQYDKVMKDRNAKTGIRASEIKRPR